MPTQPILIQKAVDFGWETAKKHFWFFLGVIVTTGLISAIPEFIGDTFSNRDIPLIVFVFFTIGALFFWLLQVLVSIGVTKIALSFVKGKKPPYSMLFDGIEHLVSMVVSSLLYGVMTFVGFVLLILPGIYIWVRFQFYGYCIIEHKAGPIEALQMSWHMTDGKFWNVLLVNLVVIGINILGVLALGIGLLWSIPTTMVAFAHIFKQLELQKKT